MKINIVKCTLEAVEACPVTWRIWVNDPRLQTEGYFRKGQSYASQLLAEQAMGSHFKEQGQAYECTVHPESQRYWEQLQRVGYANLYEHI